MQLLVPWSIMFSRRCCQAVLERQLLLLHCPLHRRRDDFGLSPKSKQVTSTVMIPAYSNLWTCASYSWLSIFVVGGIIEIQRFFPDTLYWWYNSPFARGCLPDAWAPSTPSFWCPVSSGLHMGEGQKGKRWMVSWWTGAASFDYSLKSKRSMHPREVWEPTSLHQGNQSLNRLLDVFFCQPRVLQCCTRQTHKLQQVSLSIDPVARCQKDSLPWPAWQVYSWWLLVPRWKVGPGTVHLCEVYPVWFVSPSVESFKCRFCWGAVMGSHFATFLGMVSEDLSGFSHFWRNCLWLWYWR